MTTLVSLNNKARFVDWCKTSREDIDLLKPELQELCAKNALCEVFYSFTLPDNMSHLDLFNYIVEQGEGFYRNDDEDGEYDFSDFYLHEVLEDYGFEDGDLYKLLIEKYKIFQNFLIEFYEQKLDGLFVK